MRRNIGIFLVVFISSSYASMAKMGGGKDAATWDAEQAWNSQIGINITESSLLKSLTADKNRLDEEMRKKVASIVQAYKDGHITIEEAKRQVQTVPVPIVERNNALEIISGNKYQSPEIDRVVMEVYAQSMENKVTRLKCIEVMLNNAPQQGLQMLSEYIADEVRIEFDFRLIGASLMLEQGRPIPQALIDQGLASSNKIERTRAEFMQHKLNQIHLPNYEPPPPVKTIAPPRNR